MSWEIDPKAANGIALAASCLSIAMWASPIRDVFTAKRSILKTRSTENVATGFGFVAGVFNCVLWAMYAVTRLDLMIVSFIVNCLGFLLNSSFVVTYWYFCSPKQLFALRMQMLAMIIITIIACSVWAYEQNNDMVGYLAVVVNVLSESTWNALKSIMQLTILNFSVFGPLAAAGDVIRNRSTQGLSLVPMYMSLVASFMWFVFGVYIREIPAMLPNIIGFGLAIVQIILYYWAKSQERKPRPRASIVADSEDAPVVSSHGLMPGSSMRERTPSLLVEENGELRERSPSLLVAEA